MSAEIVPYDDVLSDTVSSIEHENMASDSVDLPEELSNGCYKCGDFPQFFCRKCGTRMCSINHCLHHKVEFMCNGVHCLSRFKSTAAFDFHKHEHLIISSKSVEEANRCLELTGQGSMPAQLYQPCRVSDELLPDSIDFLLACQLTRRHYMVDEDVAEETLRPDSFRPQKFLWDPRVRALSLLIQWKVEDQEPVITRVSETETISEGHDGMMSFAYEDGVQKDGKGLISQAEIAQALVSDAHIYEVNGLLLGTPIPPQPSSISFIPDNAPFWRYFYLEVEPDDTAEGPGLLWIPNHRTFCELLRGRYVDSIPSIRVTEHATPAAELKPDALSPQDFLSPQTRELLRSIPADMHNFSAIGGLESQSSALEYIKLANFFYAWITVTSYEIRSKKQAERSKEALNLLGAALFTVIHAKGPVWDSNKTSCGLPEVWKRLASVLANTLEKKLWIEPKLYSIHETLCRKLYETNRHDPDLLVRIKFDSDINQRSRTLPVSGDHLVQIKLLANLMSSVNVEEHLLTADEAVAKRASKKVDLEGSKPE